jgi:hypothetical protein
MISAEILKQYKPSDDSFLINCGHPYRYEPDPSLTPIRISLPKPPKLSLIDGYGLPALDQKWRRPVMPEKLAQLEKQVKRDLERQSKDTKGRDNVTGYKIIETIWSKIEENYEYYQNEISWIRKMWWHRIYGYWVFIKGKPTYICGSHFFYLTFWKIDGTFYPEYRDKDRRVGLSWEYLDNTKETFKYLDKDGNAEVNENGEYEMVEMPYKTSFGVAFPKGRRQGISNFAQCNQYEYVSRHISALGVIFSMTKDSASDLFKNLTVTSFTEMPFFFLPIWEGYFLQSTEINFQKPKYVVLGDDLKSSITFANSAYGKEFDGGKIDRAVFDEPGKTSECDVTKRWATHKKGMSLGPEILGFSFHISTTEDLDVDGGKHFQKQVNSSDFYKRNEINGQTHTGLTAEFFPSYDGYEKCIDYWGFSVIDDPTEEQIKYGYKFKYGAKKILQSDRDVLLNSKNPLDKIEYRREVVKHPFTLDECFQLTTGSANVNMDIINTRLAELRKIREPFIRGNFEWVDNVFGGNVYFRVCSDGRWEVSKQLNPGEQNLKTLVYIYDEFTNNRKQVWKPLYPNRFTLGADPYDFKGNKQLAVNTGSYMSDGGIAVYWERDRTIDPSDNIYEQETGKFVAVYRNRPTSDVYDADVLKAAIYYGAMVYPETNKGDLFKYFTADHNFDGFLIYDWDESAKKYKTKPGIYQAEKSKQEISDLYRNHIEYRCHKENHASLLMEIASVQRFEDFTKNDMYVAGGCALLGSKSRTRQMLETVDNISDDFEEIWRNGGLRM